MRVLHVIASVDPRNGGPVAALGGLAPAQVEAGLDVRVVSTFTRGEDTSIAGALEKRGAKVELLGPAKGPLVRHELIEPTLRRCIGDADAVHIHGLYEEIQHQACRMAEAQRRPYVVRACGMLDPWSLRQKWLKKRLYFLWRLRRNLDHASAIHVSTSMEAAMVAKLRLRAPNLVEPNGIVLAEYEELPQAGSFRRRYPELEGWRYIAFLGRIHPQKGLELLIPALARIADRETKLVVIGPDSHNYRTKMESLVRKHGVGERVMFVGPLGGAEKVAALADAELMALPSYHENFGVAVFEALAAGTPVIVSDHVYTHGEISAARVGAVCRLDVSDLAATLDRWLGDDGLRREAALRARTFVRESYDWRRIAERWRDQYERLAA